MIELIFEVNGMKIALAQMKMDTDIEKNFQKSLQLICEAAEKKADLICFPQLLY